MQIVKYPSSTQPKPSNNWKTEPKGKNFHLNQDTKENFSVPNNMIENPDKSVQNSKPCKTILFDICKLCLIQQTLISLTCRHSSCQKCMKNEFLKQKNLILEGKVRCWACLDYVDFNLVYFAFGGTAEVQFLKLQMNYKVQIPRYQCEICYFDFSVEEFITLDCEHRFCRTCIVLHISSLVIEKKVSRSDFCCPKCNEYISPHIIRAQCSDEIYKKYNNAFFDVYQPENSSISAKKCPFCECLLEFDKSITKITCVKCKKSFCVYCSENHKSEICEKQNLENLKNQDLRIKSCPRCKEIVEKDEGCNFVQCPWPACHKFSFCYLCLKPLTPNEHYSHFPDGAYVDNCLTLNQINSLNNK